MSTTEDTVGTPDDVQPVQPSLFSGGGAGKGWFATLRGEKAAMFGSIGILILILAAIFAPLIARHGPIDINFEDRFQPPSAEYWFGTDQVGRDLFARVLYGARISLVVGLLSVSAAAGIGGLTGAFAGYYGGKIGGAMMRFWDALFAIPVMLVAIGTVAVLGTSLRSVGVAIAIGLSAYFARITRGAVVQELAYDYVEALRGLGISNMRVMFRHVLPNALSPVIVQGALALSSAVLLEASLSFLGLGAQEPDPSWGAMLATSRRFLRSAPYYGIIPGVAVTYFVVCVNLAADGLRVLLDPRAKRHEGVDEQAAQG